MALPDCESCDSCAEEKGHTEISDHSLLFVDGWNRVVLQPGTFLGNAFAPFRRRVLALVGRAPLGRRLFRGFRDSGYCISIRQAARHPGRERRAGCTAFRRDLFKRRNYRHASSPLFAGTPTVAIAFGSVFSALEIVPLLLVGHEAVANIRRSKARPWLKQYKWVVYFFVAVAFWNLVGAGIFGFMINPPIALYYVQGLNTTAVHAHGALYGVYGTLGLG